MPVHHERKDAVAILTLDSPPVNGMGLAVREALVGELQRAQNAADVTAIVITGAGRFFSGGADIREFGSAQATQEPSLHSVLAAIEASPKPVIVAINGTTLGGGLELSLAAHYRLAVADAQVGLPEVKLGLLPGAGGTQRLPRAVGLDRALEMIVSGTPMRAGKLADTRLFDQIVDGDVVAAAVAFAATIAGRTPPRVRDWPVAATDADASLAAARARVAASTPHEPAPAGCIDAIEAAVRRPFDDGLAFERAAFMALLDSPESKALRHAFFAERAASKITNIDKGAVPRDIRKIGVLGAGTMGTGISINFLDAGLPVVLIETNREALDRGVATIQRQYDSSVRKARISAEQAQRRMALLQPSLELTDLAEADLIIEAVFEDQAVKESVFRQIDAVARPGAILATNTSTLDVDRIAAVTSRPQDVVGLHFFSPANIMRLLEIVRGAATADDVLLTAMQVARITGKTAVVSGVCDGFIGNRMVEQYFRQAGFLLDEGASPRQIDEAMERFGFAMGPFRMSDLAGNDIGWAIRKRRAIEQPQMIYSASADRICELGRFGQKTGKGWYDYQPGDRTAQDSAEVAAVLDAHVRSLGTERRSIGDDEIVQRLLYALVDEGARILEEGIAARSSDIDVVYLHGYGFPRWRGGPMFHADSIGLDRVLSAIEGYATGYRGEVWQPSSRLRRLAASGAGFCS